LNHPNAHHQNKHLNALGEKYVKIDSFLKICYQFLHIISLSVFLIYCAIKSTFYEKLSLCFFLFTKISKSKQICSKINVKGSNRYVWVDPWLKNYKRPWTFIWYLRVGKLTILRLLRGCRQAPYHTWEFSQLFRRQIWG